MEIFEPEPVWLFARRLGWPWKQQSSRQRGREVLLLIRIPCRVSMNEAVNTSTGQKKQKKKQTTKALHDDQQMEAFPIETGQNAVVNRR